MKKLFHELFSGMRPLDLIVVWPWLLGLILAPCVGVIIIFRLVRLLFSSIFN